MIPIDEQDTPSLVDLLQETALFLWKEWPRDMELASTWHGGFTLRGICPHCNREAAFQTVTSIHEVGRQGYAGNRQVAAASCIACNKYILGIIKLQVDSRGSSEWFYEVHYPLGKPDDTVADEIPDHIKLDFKEALRCLWVNAYNATAEMCRRSIESSCLNLGAPKSAVLEDMIDWLEAQRIITPPLKEAAHKVRLGGNRGAHPPATPATSAVAGAPPPATPAGPVTVIEKDHAQAIVEFTRHFLHHVYVVPKQLDKYDFSKPKAAKP